MTTHELAATLDRLKTLFGDNLKTAASQSLGEAATAFRELPDQNLRALLTLVRRSASPQPAEAGGAPVVPAAVAGVLARVRAIRDGSAPAGEVLDLSGLKTNDQLKDILRAFKQPITGTKSELIARVRRLCVRTESVATSAPAVAAGVDAGLALYKRLEQDRQLTVADVRAAFAPLRDLPKPVVEEVSRLLGYTPAGSREDILDRLLKNLEGIKMSQHHADRIFTGTGG